MDNPHNKINRPTSLRCSHLLPQNIVEDLARNWLREDTPSFDYGGYVVGEKEERAVLLCKSPGVLSGVPFVDAVFKELGCTVEWQFDEGAILVPLCTVAVISGKINKLLQGERVALNCLTRASGISTIASELLEIKNSAGWHGEIAGTRKTTPGFRLVEKYSLLIGGISTHRYDLSAMIMLKDNHIWSVGNIAQAVKCAKKAGGFSTKIEVECRSITEGAEALLAGADVIMLDNFTPEALHAAAKELKEKFPHAIIEASGGINEENIRNYFGPHVDVISLGCLTQGYKTVDFSMKVKKEGRDPSNPVVKI